MNQLGKNLVLLTCVVGALLAVLGLKRKFSNRGEQALLSQPAEEVESVTPEDTKKATQPRVIQAAPADRRDPTIVSPTGPAYSGGSNQTQPANQRPISPIAPSRPTPAAQLDPPELVPVSEPAVPAVDGQEDAVTMDASDPVEVAKVPVALPPRPDFVVTGEDDSFWTISERIYGSSAYYRALFRHNETNVLRPDQLRAGTRLQTPSLEVLQELYPNDYPNDPSQESSQ